MLTMTGLTKTYRTDTVETTALDSVDLDIVGFAVFTEDIERVLQSAVLFFKPGIHYLAGYSAQRGKLCVSDR